MKKRTLFWGVCLIAVVVLFGSMGAAAATPQIITFDTEHYSAAAIDEVAEAYGLTPILGSFYSGDEEAAEAIRFQPMVLSVEPMRYASLGEETAAPYFNDRLYGEQWGLAAIRAEQCWHNYTKGSEDVVVCVIDSGFYAAHPDAQKNIKVGQNYVADQEVNVDNDDASHGTSVAGVIGATCNNGEGIAGLVPRVSVISQKAFYWDAEQKLKIGPADAIASAIKDAVDVYHADVINMSFLFSEDVPVIREACEYAVSKGTILVAAAGNNGDKGSALQYPAAYDCVIGVGSVGRNEDGSYTVAVDSARNRSVYCSAPGVNIRTLKNPYSNEDEDVREYRVVSGTSLATPHVAGLAAMAVAYQPDLTVEDFRRLLRDTSVDLGEKGYDTSYGYGMIDCEKMMRYLSGGVYRDVTKSDWFYTAVLKAYWQDLMVGYGDDLFYPQDELTRGMFITILHRIDGSPKSTATFPFTDVESGAYYREAVAWGYENGISLGIEKTVFAPEEPIKREELVAMLYRYTTEYKKLTLPEKETTLTFRDSDAVSSWAKDAVLAMVKAGVINGYKQSDADGTYYTFEPRKMTTRAEAATLLANLPF